MSDIAVQERSRRKRWARPGSSHDYIVRTLLMVLPAGIGVLGAFLVMARCSWARDVVPARQEQGRCRQRTAAHPVGALSRCRCQGQPFVLRAGSAVQKSSADPVVQLNDLAAGIQLSDGPAQVKAQRGRYDMESEQVAVDGPIAFRTADGYRPRHARFDDRPEDATADRKRRGGRQYAARQLQRQQDDGGPRQADR